jgi:hypothetical protein
MVKPAATDDVDPVPATTCTPDYLAVFLRSIESLAHRSAASPTTATQNPPILLLGYPHLFPRSEAVLFLTSSSFWGLFPPSGRPDREDRDFARFVSILGLAFYKII